MNYEEDYHTFFHKNLLKSREYYKFRAKYSEFIYWRYFNKEGRTLEFACGLGQNIFLHKDESIGVDISEFCIEECRKRGIKVLKSLESTKQKFDNILSCHSLEHLEDPYNILKKLRNQLTSEGTLVLVLPAERNIIKKFKPSKSQHLFNWTFGSINQLLYKTGFDIKLNKFNYAKGFSLFYKLPFKLAVLSISILGFLTNTKEMIIVAKKKQ